MITEEWLSFAMTVECLLIMVTSGLAMGKLADKQRQADAERRIHRHAMGRTSRPSESGHYYHLMWMLFLSDFGLGLTSFPAFLTWTVSNSYIGEYTALCYWQSATSVFTVASSVLMIALVAFERQHQIVGESSVPFALHALLMVLGSLWAIFLGLFGVLILQSAGQLPRAPCGYFCAPSWSDIQLRPFTLLCIATLIVCCLTILISSARILCYLPRQYLLKVWPQLAGVFFAFFIHWTGYAVIMFWQTFFLVTTNAENIAEFSPSIRIADGVVTFLGFNNSLVNASAYLYWSWSSASQRRWEDEVTVKSSSIKPTPRKTKKITVRTSSHVEKHKNSPPMGSTLTITTTTTTTVELPGVSVHVPVTPQPPPTPTPTVLPENK